MSTAGVARRTNCRGTSISDARPGEPDRLERGQFAEHRDPLIGDRAAAELEVPEPGKAREMAQASIGEPVRTAEVERGDVIDLRDALEERVGHLATRVERRELLLPEDGDGRFPFHARMWPK